MSQAALSTKWFLSCTLSIFGWRRKKSLHQEKKKMFLYPFWLFDWCNNQMKLAYISRRTTYLILYVQSSISIWSPRYSGRWGLHVHWGLDVSELREGCRGLGPQRVARELTERWRSSVWWARVCWACGDEDTGRNLASMPCSAPPSYHTHPVSFMVTCADTSLLGAGPLSKFF